MKHLLLSAILLIFSANAQDSTSVTTNTTQPNTTTQIHSSYTAVEKAVRKAAVKVITPEGHGSGSLIKYKDMTLVLTAQHVADGRIGGNYFVINGATMERAILVYSDPVHDIAVLYLAEGNQLEGRGLRYSPTSNMSGIGTGITYSGHPSWHSLMTYRGHIAGMEHIDGRGPQLMLNTYGWFGCSGSVIYDNSGDIVGILWGVDIETRPDYQVQENMIWVSPIQNIDMSLAISELCIALEQEPRACRK